MRRSTEFDATLKRGMRAVQPDVYAKGGDYTVASLNAEEAEALRECGATIEIVSLVKGKSTTNLVEKIAENKKLAAKDHKEDKEQKP